MKIQKHLWDTQDKNNFPYLTGVTEVNCYFFEQNDEVRKECEPLREIPADKIKQEDLYKSWKEKGK